MVRQPDQTGLAGLQADATRPRAGFRRLRPFLLALLLALAPVSLAAEQTTPELWDEARNGDTDAQYRLGLHYANKSHRDYDPKAARYWLELAAEGGSGEAAADLGFLLMENPESEEDFQTAVAALAAGAEAGVAEAQFRMASLLANGFSLSAPDARRARTLYALAAAQGHAGSQAALGVYYFQGIAGEQSIERATQLFSAAAAQGNALGQYHMGVLKLSGANGVPDPAQALTWLQQAADQGLPQALLVLGQMRVAGEHLPPDLARGMTMVLKAAQAGLPDAQFQMGVWESSGVGGAADDRAAVQWFRRAAEQGHPDAQYLLGNHLATGRGVEANMEQGLFWLNAAAKSGHPRANQRIQTYLEQQNSGTAQE